MNKQLKTKNGEIVGRGIEWTDYAWNLVAGCHHGCRWIMPDGSEAKCYAEDVANGVARSAYKQGFEHHYWHPQRLEEPYGVSRPSLIFVDSMADLFGHWVPEEQVKQVLSVMKQTPHHQYQSLTKAAPQMLKYVDELPPNLWTGVSMPPTRMFGKLLHPHQQEQMFSKALATLDVLDQPVRWVSFEPLSFDVAPLLEAYGVPFEWAVIGAATNGRATYQPRRAWVKRLLEVLDSHGVKVFFKGNLEWSPWREEMPECAPERPGAEKPPKQMSLL